MSIPAYLNDCKVGINPIILSRLMRETTLDPKKARKVEEQGLLDLPVLSALNGGTVTPDYKRGIDGRLHTRGTFPLQSIPSAWRPSITVTDPDHRIIYADYTACHWQILAYLSGDADMIAFYEGNDDFYTALASIPDVDRKALKIAANAWLNGGRMNVLRDALGSAEKAQTFMDALAARFTDDWPTAGAFIEQVKDHVMNDGYEKGRGQALGVGLMRIEAALMDKVFEHPTFSETYGGRVLLPMRDGFVVSCPADQQDDLGDWLQGHMTHLITKSEDRMEEAQHHVDIEIHGTSWGQVDDEDVPALIGDDLKDRAYEARSEVDDPDALLLACVVYPDHMADKRKEYHHNTAQARGIRAAQQAADRVRNRLRRQAQAAAQAASQEANGNLPVLTRRINADGEEGGIEDTVQNLESVLTDDPTMSLWFNEWLMDVFNGDDPVDWATWEADVIVRCESAYGWPCRIRPGLIKATTLRVAKQTSRHPLKAEIEGLQWDGYQRVDTWLAEALYGEWFDTDWLEKEFDISKDEQFLTKLYGRLMVIAMMARLFDPGPNCKAEEMVVLCGGQGVGKQRLWKALAGAENYVGTARPKSDADAALMGLKAWIMEDQEMGSHGGSKVEEVKAYMSRAVDHVRFPYGHRNEAVARHFVMTGSTNNGERLLKDASGSRRFNVARIPFYQNVKWYDPAQPTIDVDAVVADRDQILAEALHLYRSGERWWIDRDLDREAFELRGKVNESMFTETNEVDIFAQEVFAKNGGGNAAAFTSSAFYEAYDGDLKNSQAVTGRFQHIAREALVGAGFVYKSVKRGGIPKKMWVKVLPLGTTPLHTRTGLAENQWGNDWRQNLENDRFRE